MRISRQLGFSIMMLMGVWSLHQEKQLFRLGISFAIVSLLFSIVAFFRPDSTIELVQIVVVLLFCAVSGFIAARDVFSGNRIDRNILCGAICVYLLMGLIWTILYSLIIELQPDSFNGLGTYNGKVDFDSITYFSFVTMVSLGYGDITPVAPLARTLAYLEAIAGQFYLAIMVAGLVGLYMTQRKR